MSKQLNRYQNPTIIEHLASQYVIGALPARVRARVERLRLQNFALEYAINDWQNRFVSFDETTPELDVDEQNWQQIEQQLGFVKTHSATKPRSLLSQFGEWLTTPRLVLTSFMFSFVALISFLVVNPLNSTDPLSYVAVLENQQDDAHLVASTYGESKKLVLNIVKSTPLDQEQDLELWVISKTDQQARSLGVLPQGQEIVEQQLSDAQWRLIKDSHSLIVTLEEKGGAAIGEPSDDVVSRGLCVRLTDWRQAST